MEMTATNEEQIMRMAGIRITAVRLLIFKTIRKEFSGIFSLSDLEDKLQTVDKSTIFRTLSLFSSKALLDCIDDGSGSQKYCVSLQNRRHVHFSCHICHKTVCLTDIVLPEVKLPDGYIVDDTEYVVKGICPKCRMKQ